MYPVIIVGAAGQDGRLMNELLEAEGKQVIRLGRNDLDIDNAVQVGKLLRDSQPSQIYYLAAHHHSSEDYLGKSDAELFVRSFQVHVTGLIHFLEAIREHTPCSRLFYAASSHIFGAVTSAIQDEQTPFNPTCVYGITKTAGLQACRYYRQAHGIFASVGILFNHESNYRKPNFVTQKIIRGVLAIASGTQEKLVLGSLSARIDWGYAPDYVEAIRSLLTLPQADDFVIATGQSHSVEEFVSFAFEAVGLDWRKYVVEDSSLITKQPRTLIGNYSKLQKATGWRPKVSFRQMVELLISNHANAQ